MNSTEIWKPIDGFENYYHVSTFGRIKSLARKIECISRWGSVYERATKDRIKVPMDNGLGYLQVKLEVKGSKVVKYIHRLVAEAFIYKAEIGLEVDHIDSNKSNNSVENLRWVSRKENMIKCYEENPHILLNLKNQ